MNRWAKNLYRSGPNHYIKRTLVISTTSTLDSIGFMVSLSLVEETALLRNPHLTTTSVTWREFGSGRSLDEATRQAVAKFANNYLKANPGK